MRKRKQSTLSQRILEVTDGLLAKATDFVLCELFLTAHLMSNIDGLGPKSVWRSYYKAQADLQKFNYLTLQRAFYYLKKKGLIEYARDDVFTKQLITKQGKERLASLFPKYYEQRSWDGKIYLITYDIAEENRRERNLLREFLRKIGCGMLQASVWLTPYNPQDTLKDFIETKVLGGSIIISDVGRDGSIGKMSLGELVNEVYKLGELNQNYRKFINRYGEKRKSEITPTRVAFEFFAILNKDPQLPFELLPRDWKGDEAYELFKKLIGKEQIDGLWTN